MSNAVQKPSCVFVEKDHSSFTLMIAVAALIGIQILIIEHVANLDENDAFKTGLFDRLRSHGYTVILKHQFSAARFLPVNRNRLAMIASHSLYLQGTACLPTSYPEVLWMKSRHANWSEFCCRVFSDFPGP